MGPGSFPLDQQKLRQRGCLAERAEESQLQQIPTITTLPTTPCSMFSVKRLNRNRSVDLPGFQLIDPPSSLVTKATDSVVAMTTEELQNNSTNQKHRSIPWRGELKRGITIDEGQKIRLERERKDGRLMSFQRPPGAMEYRVESRDTLNSIALKFDTTPNELVTLNKLFSRAIVPGKVLYVPDPDFVSSAESSPSLSPIIPLSQTSSEPDQGQKSGPSQLPPCQSRVVCSTSEEEALTERFLKINCKYITDGQGTVNGVLLLTPTTIMFEPQKSDPLVKHRGCDEFGIMATLEEVMSAAMCPEVTDPGIRGQVPDDLQLPPSSADPSPMSHVACSNLEDSGLRSNESVSLEASLSEDVFTESEVSLRQEEDSAERKRHTPSQHAPGPAHIHLPSQDAPCLVQIARKHPGLQQASGKEETTERASVAGPGQEPVPEHVYLVDPGSWTILESQGSETVAADASINPNQNSQSDVHAWRTHTMPSTNEQADGGQLTASEASTLNKEECEKEAGSGEAPQEEEVRRRRRKEVRFLCVRVGRPMMKTFVSPSSAAMQRYVQQHRNTHQYWFAIPAERSDHLLSFLIHWNPHVFAEEGMAGSEGCQPGFMVVKRNQEAKPGSDQPPVPDITSKDWEVVSKAEYQRRIDALNSEDVQVLCRRLQISTKQESDQKLSAAGRSDLDSEVFRPTLSDPSDLLTADHIKKLAKHLPPRTIGYPWTLAFSTANHGTSIKTLYRNMAGLDTPILMVVKDCDGQVFKWTGDNMFFLKGDMDSLAFGGGGEFGLWLDGDLYHGRSNSCRTFGNPRLTQREDFVLRDIEIWAFH